MGTYKSRGGVKKQKIDKEEKRKAEGNRKAGRL